MNSHPETNQKTPHPKANSFQRWIPFLVGFLLALGWGFLVFYDMDYSNAFFSKSFGGPATDIEKITTAVKEYKEIEKYCRVVDIEEIKNNAFNLNISRYVDTTPEEEEINVKSAVKELHEIEQKRIVVEKTMNAHLKGLGL